VEMGAVLARGTRVGRGQRVPGGQLWAGRPAAYVRHLTDLERQRNLHSAIEHSERIAGPVAEGFHVRPHAYIDKIRRGLEPPISYEPPKRTVLP